MDADRRFTLRSYDRVDGRGMEKGQVGSLRVAELVCRRRDRIGQASSVVKLRYFERSELATVNLKLVDQPSREAPIAKTLRQQQREQTLAWISTNALSTLRHAWHRA